MFHSDHSKLNTSEELSDVTDVDLFEDVDLGAEVELPQKDSFNLGKEIANLFFMVLLVLSLSFLLANYVVQRTDVDGNSMQTTLNDKDTIFIDKVSYRFSEPDRFDIIVFDYMYKLDTHYIKRIIALPGETVQIVDGYVYIDKNDGNGLTKLTEDVYGKEVIVEGNYGLAKEPVTVGENEYFVLGDNRNMSHDSRRGDVGLVKKDQILGKAFVRIFPLDQIKWLAQ